MTFGRVGYVPVYWNPLYEERISMWGEGYPFDAPYVSKKVYYKRGDCPEAEAYIHRTVGLPVLHNPCDKDLIDDIAGTFAKVLQNMDKLR